MHASQLLTWTGVGIVAPVVMWLISKDESREANRQGIAIVNGMLSSLLYLVISGLASLIVIGIPMLFVLAGLNIPFRVVEAVDASRGTLWRYPLTIHFFNPEPAGEQTVEAAWGESSIIEPRAGQPAEICRVEFLSVNVRFPRKSGQYACAVSRSSALRLNSSVRAVLRETAC